MKSEIRFKDREHLAFYNMVLKQTRMVHTPLAKLH